MNNMYAMLEPNTNKFLGWYRKDTHRQVIVEDLILELRMNYEIRTFNL